MSEKLERFLNMKRILVSLLLVGSLSAMHSVKVKEETTTLTREQCWLVHATGVFPRNGHVIAGALLNVQYEGAQQQTYQSMYRQADYVCTAWRNTVHWSLNSLVYPHIDYNNRRLVTRDLHAYIILEPLRAFADTRLRGYWQDVYHIGGHALSPDAIILVDEDDASYQQLLGGFKGQIRTYKKGTQRKVVEEILAGQGAPVLMPCMTGLSSFAHMPCYHAGGPKQRVMLGTEECSSQDVVRVMELDNAIHKMNPVGRVQGLASEFLMEMRMVQLLESMWTDFFPDEDAPSVHTTQCVACKKEGNVRACSACTYASYCSQECQRNHWPHHKLKCKNVKGAFGQIQGIHKKYLAQCEYLQPQYQEFCEDFLKMFNGYLEENASKRDIQHTQKYKAYLGMIFNLLYSPAYTALRNEYRVETLEGFIAYGKEIRRRVAEDEHLLGRD